MEDSDDRHELTTLPTSHSRLRSVTTSSPVSPASLVPFVLYALISSLVVVLALKLNLLFQTQPNYNVDVDNCTCDCWDRQFKGGYGSGGYKHVYFQMTLDASLVWLWSAFHFILLVNFVKLATSCVLGSLSTLVGAQQRPTSPKVRSLVLFTSILNFYGMFYNWWITLPVMTNTATILTMYGPIKIALYSLLRQGSSPDPQLLVAAISVCSSHIFLSLMDQGFAHILSGKGAVVRDVMFVVSDLAGLVGVASYVRGSLIKHTKVIGAEMVILVTSYLIVKSYAGYDTNRT